MLRRLSFLGGLLAGVVYAQAIEWRALSVTAGGGQWSLAKGSQGRSTDHRDRPLRVALVRHELGDQVVRYRAAVLAAECGRPRGTITLVPDNGSAPLQDIFEADGKTAAATLAAAVCRP